MKKEEEAAFLNPIMRPDPNFASLSHRGASPAKNFFAPGACGVSNTARRGAKKFFGSFFQKRTPRFLT
jgi:hypothetical protein